MEDVQTGGEPTVVEPKEVQVDEVVIDGEPANPPAEAEDKVEVTEEVVPTDDEVLNELEKKVKIKKVPSRKEVSIEKWQKKYDETIGEDGSLDVDALKELYQKNPKGLEAFAEKNELDVTDLLADLSETAGNSELLDRLNNVEAKLQMDAEAKQQDAFKTQMTSLTAEAGLSVKSFYDEFGELFTTNVKKFTDQGVSLQDATEAAFAMTAGKSVITHAQDTMEKQNVLDSAVDMPDGEPKGDKQFTKLLTRNEVNAMDDGARIAYKKQFNTTDGIPAYSDGASVNKDGLGR